MAQRTERANRPVPRSIRRQQSTSTPIAHGSTAYDQTVWERIAPETIFLSFALGFLLVILWFYLTYLHPKPQPVSILDKL